MFFVFFLFYYIILYIIIHYYTILYYTILYYTIFYLIKSYFFLLYFIWTYDIILWYHDILSNIVFTYHDMICIYIYIHIYILSMWMHSFHPLFHIHIFPADIPSISSMTRFGSFRFRRQGWNHFAPFTHFPGSTRFSVSGETEKELQTLKRNKYIMIQFGRVDMIMYLYMLL